MLKYVNSDIVFQEIPDEVTLAVNLSNCPCRCAGCHSRYLWDDIGEPLTEHVIDSFMDKYGKSITCLCFMGGDAAPAEVVLLSRYVHEAYPGIKVGWYSGRDRTVSRAYCGTFDYIKVGPYVESLGGLKSPDTNQRLYKLAPDGSIEDITCRFWNM